MLRINQYIKNQRGQSLVEFALVLPVLLMLVVGLLGFGLVMQDYISLAEAARAGARYAAVHPSDTANIKLAAKNAVPAYTSLITVNDPVFQTNPTYNDTSVSVTVTYNRLLIPMTVPDPTDITKKYTILPTDKNGNYLVTATAVMRVE
ncbi:MAG: TadE/TadG family type IV pilus assembly protein [Negativicutes bacterium]|nr:TadE/TadG family type IV pilus assembly protein [Negativicutes bacterium]